MVTVFKTPKPSVGLAIATFGGVPFIQLALESRRRYYPDVPALIIDDGSSKRGEFVALSRAYGTSFFSSQERRGWKSGDLWACVHGLDWALESRIEVLVKMSRRFVPLVNWVPGLQDLAFENQAATYGNRCKHFGIHLRTECIGFSTRIWRLTGASEHMRSIADNVGKEFYTEGYIWKLALSIQRRLWFPKDDTDHHWDMDGPENAYADWPFVSDSRITQTSRALWYNANTYLDYEHVAATYGLTYRDVDFAASCSI